MKEIISFCLFLGFALLGFAQTPQIALVKPNGTTTIHSTFDAAYTAATDDDYIYLPGGTFTVANPISKRLHIIGAGSNIDSSLVTGITRLNSLTIEAASEGGSVEGIYFTSKAPGNCNNGSIDFFEPFSNYTVSNCFLNNGISFTSLSSNIVIRNNIIGSSGCGSLWTSIKGNLINSIINNNRILSTLGISGEANIEFNNNIFFFYQQFYNLGLPNSCTYNNNIFQQATSASNNSIFNNNANASLTGSNNIINNNVWEVFPDIFENPGTGPYFYYDVNNNYHIKPTSLCKNSGTDGTDRGIYGGMFPWLEGQVPSNPHIYFKQVAGQTNSSGQLQVEFKVRAGN